MKKYVLALLLVFLGVYVLVIGEARSGEAELIIPPQDVMGYLNNLNDSTQDIRASDDFEEYEGLSSIITADLEWFWRNCNTDKEKAPECVSKEAEILRDIHSYVSLSHDFVEQMISSLDLPANLRYSLLKSARFHVANTEEPEEDRTMPSIQNVFGSSEGSHTLTVLTGLTEVFTPLPDHGPKLERALAERVVELEANYAFLKGAKRHITNLVQLKYVRLNALAADNRITSMLESLSFLKGSFSGELDRPSEGKKPAGVVILEQLKKGNE